MPPKLTDYERYLRVPELLSLQKPVEQLACSDELLFQVVHQSAELWMKLCEHELNQAHAAVQADRIAAATAAVLRVHRVQRLLTEGLEVLYTLSSVDYMRIRAVLGRGSGQESPGFRRMLALPGELWPAVSDLLTRHSVTLLDIYREPTKHPHLYALCEALCEYDLRMQEWRNRHILLVYRTIGVGTPSLKGKHSELLERGLRTQFFPALWAVRDELFAEWTTNHPDGASTTLATS